MIGRRVWMRYGFATVVDEIGDGLYGVVADVGGWWVCTADEIWLVDEVPA